jgi:hypothetical protein
MDRKYGQKQDLIIKNLAMMRKKIADFQKRISDFQTQELGVEVQPINLAKELSPDKPKNVFESIEQESDGINAQLDFLGETIKQLENSINPEIHERL